MSFESTPLSVKKEKGGNIEGVEAVQRRMVEVLAESEERGDRNMKKYSEEYWEALAEDAFHKESLQHGNIELSMVGVAHISETMPLLRKQIEERVRGTDFTILETGVETVDPDLARCKKSVVNKDDFFFIGVERMARKHRKKIILTDPGYTYDESAPEYQKAQDELDKKLQGGIATAAAVGVVGAGFMAIKKTADTISQRSLSRRDMLKLGAAGVVGGAGGYFMKANIGHQREHPYRGDRALVYNLIDYRDVMIAEGIDQLSQSLSKKMKAALVFGADHIEGIKYYLQNPKIRKMKIDMYAPYQEISRPEISVHEFQLDQSVSPENAKNLNFGEWKQTTRADILPKTKTPQ